MAFCIWRRVFARPAYFRQPNTSSKFVDGKGRKGRSRTPSDTSSTANSAPGFQLRASRTDLGNTTCPFDESLVVSISGLASTLSKIPVRHYTVGVLPLQLDVVCESRIGRLSLRDGKGSGVAQTSCFSKSAALFAFNVAKAADLQRTQVCATPLVMTPTYSWVQALTSGSERKKQSQEQVER